MIATFLNCNIWNFSICYVTLALKLVTRSNVSISQTEIIESKRYRGTPEVPVLNYHCEYEIQFGKYLLHLFVSLFLLSGRAGVNLN